jgi:hypothetical protein
MLALTEGWTPHDRARLFFLVQRRLSLGDQMRALPHFVEGFAPWRQSEIFWL